MATSKRKIDFKSLLKIYWSISWRANIQGITIYLILFSLLPFLVNFLIYSNTLDTFREFILGICHISASVDKISTPVLLQSIKTGSISFIIDYLLFWYGFKRVMSLNLYSILLPVSPYSTYNKIFLAPLTISNLLASEMFGIAELPFTILINTLYFITVLYFLKKAIQQPKIT